MKASTSLEDRIAKAESERDRWRLCGSQEKYLEACSMVDALELQLEALNKAPSPSVPNDETRGEREA